MWIKNTLYTSLVKYRRESIIRIVFHIKYKIWKESLILCLFDMSSPSDLYSTFHCIPTERKAYHQDEIFILKHAPLTTWAECFFMFTIHLKCLQNNDIMSRIQRTRIFDGILHILFFLMALTSAQMMMVMVVVAVLLHVCQITLL